MRQWQTADDKRWTAAELFFFRTSFVFVLLFLLSFSFPHFFIPDVGALTHPFFEKLSTWFATSVLGIKEPFTKAHISDSTGFYVNALLLLIIAFLSATGWGLIDKKRRSHHLLFYFFEVGVRYYLALQLLVYGVNKIFKWQFYAPEPNTLYTTIGELPPDFLYWTAMGVSPIYSAITGSIEVIGALLLFWRRTSLIGALISLVALLNIFIINISFDISVKLYSLFLLLLCVILLSPSAKALITFLLQKPVAVAKHKLTLPKKYSVVHFVLKALLIVLILADVMGPYFKSGNYNDDSATRPPLHGAYDVAFFVKNRDTLAPLLTDTARWRRVFVHRKGYFIVQHMNDAVQDYELSYDTAAKQIWISLAIDSVEQPLNYYLPNDSSLELSGNLNGSDYFIKLNKLAINRLPAMQKGFHWTIDY